MLNYLRFSPLVLELIFLCYYYIQIKSSKFILRKSYLGKIARLIIPKRNTKRYIEKTDILNKSLSRLDLMDIVAIKISLLIVILTIATLVFIINTTMDLINIVTDLLLLVLIADFVYWAFDLCMELYVDKRIRYINIESVTLMNTLTKCLLGIIF